MLGNIFSSTRCGSGKLTILWPSIETRHFKTFSESSLLVPSNDIPELCVKPCARSWEFTYCRVAVSLSSLESVIDSSSGCPGSFKEGREGEPSVSSAQWTSFFAIDGSGGNGEANKLHDEEGTSHSTDEPRQITWF